MAHRSAKSAAATKRFSAMEVLTACQRVLVAGVLIDENHVAEIMGFIYAEAAANDRDVTDAAWQIVNMLVEDYRCELVN